MNPIICKYCQKEFTPNRSDKKFCCSNCRHNYKNRRKKYEDELFLKQSELEKLQLELENIKNALADYIEKRNSKKKIEKELKIKEDRYINTYEKWMSGTAEEIYINALRGMIKLEKNQGKKDELEDYLRFGTIDEKQYLCSDFMKKKKAIYDKIKKQRENIFSSLSVLDIIGKDSKEQSFLKIKSIKFKKKLICLNRKK